MPEECLPRVEWTAAARKQVLPRRGSGVAPPKLGTIEGLTREFSRLIPAGLRKARGSDAHHERLASEVRRCYGGYEVRSLEGREVGSRHRGRGGAVRGGSLAGNTAEDCRDGGPLLGGRREVRFAVEALAASARYQVWYNCVKKPEHRPSFVGGWQGWLLPRRHLVAADDPTYRECRELAEGIRRDLAGIDGLAARCALGGAFPDERSWHVEDADAIGDTYLDNAYWLLLASLADPRSRHEAGRAHDQLDLGLGPLHLARPRLHTGGRRGAPDPFGRLDPITVSEVMRDLLAARVK